MKGVQEVQELERKLEVARAKERLLANLSSREWGPIAKVAGEDYPSSQDDKRKLLNKVLGGKQPK